MNIQEKIVKRVLAVILLCILSVSGILEESNYVKAAVTYYASEGYKKVEQNGYKGKLR